MPPSTKQFSGIFVSYRRDDCSGHAGRLFDRLVSHFGKDRIFMDIDTIEPGEDFVTVIENAVGSCGILIAMIGRQWLSSKGDAPGRLDNPSDFVRVEIATALKRDIRVIPVLVQRANMPKPQDLPDDLAKLTRRHAVELTDLRWQSDVDQLISVLERVLAMRDETRVAEAARQVEEKGQRVKEEEGRQIDEEKQLRLETEEAKQRSAEKSRQAEEERQRHEQEDRRRVREEEQLRLEQEAARLRAEEERRREVEEEVERRKANERARLEAQEDLSRRAAEDRLRVEAENRARAEQEAEHRRADAEQEAEHRRLEEKEQKAKASSALNRGVRIVAIVVVLLLAAGAIAYLTTNRAQQTLGGAEFTTGSGLKYIEIVIGTGPSAQNGQMLSVNYTGTLENGTKFDSSYDQGRPFEFVLGTSGVIQGWEEGLRGMKVGGKRRLIIPSNLGYGTYDRPNIPQNSTLIFDIELLSAQQIGQTTVALSSPIPSPTADTMPMLNKGAFQKTLNAFIRTQIGTGSEFRSDRRIAYGDLNADGGDDAAVSFCYHIGRVVDTCRLAVFTNVKGVLTYVDAFEFEGRFKRTGEVQSIRAGKIICTTFKWAPTDAHHEPSIRGQAQFALVAYKLRERR